ncbi:hypothetical protein QZH41_005604 [Actinostola sp. cb2023]|nr:hypothetical protein QZH41_005604 [Actinostola sp. cb2023]
MAPKSKPPTIPNDNTINKIESEVINTGFLMRFVFRIVIGLAIAVGVIYYISYRVIKYWTPTNVPIYVCGNSTDYIDMKAITPEGRPKVDIFINIPVAGTWTIRRNIIRNGWLSTAKNYSVAYRFFTDGIGVDPKVLEALKKEQEEFKDLVLLPTKNGYWLTHRYLHAMFFGYKHYDFKYYLKADDDYFICLNNLMNDLQYRHKEKLLYWGHFGCERKMIAMDEGFVIISIDLAQEIIKRNNSLCCSPFGGQMIAMWVNLLEHEGYDVTYFPDNSRLMHYRSSLKKPIFLCMYSHVFPYIPMYSPVFPCIPMYSPVFPWILPLLNLLNSEYAIIQQLALESLAHITVDGM